MLETKREEFHKLLARFVAEFIPSPDGQRHVTLYEAVRAEGRRNLDDILAKQETGQDVTDDVLLRLLPYTDNRPNRESGAWVHVAPAIQGDLKRWFEHSGWTKPEDWPGVAEAILAFVVRCRDHPNQLSAACEEFSSLPYSKGLQTGFLTPILNAIHPDTFLLINNKPRRCVNYFCDTKHGQPLIQYPAINATALELVAEIEPALRAHPLPVARAADVFDMFCHWLVAVLKFGFPETRYWKIAPGENAFLWDDCREGGFIAMGWDEIGDISAMSEEAFDHKRAELDQTIGDYNKVGLRQLWVFAHDISEGDQIIANRGKSEVLGIGTVASSYYYDGAAAAYRHRLLVDWTDTQPRPVNEYGWQRTLLKLKREQFEAILDLPVLPDLPPAKPLASPFDAIFVDRDEAVWAFGILQEVTRRWGLSGPTDPRISLTLRPIGAGHHRLRLNVAGYAMLSFAGPAGADATMDLALLADLGAPWETTQTYNFKPSKGIPAFSSYEVPLATVRGDASVLEAFWATLDALRPHIGSYKTGLVANHRLEIARVLFQPDQLDVLLRQGVAPPPPPQAEPFFAAEAFALMADLGRDPTKAFYEAHKAEFRTLVEDRFQDLFAQLAALLPEQAKQALETESRLFSRILKNDYGRGGAWPWYWGAFYPKGGKRSSEAQLHVSLTGEALTAGLMVGDYAQERQALFAQNLARHRQALSQSLAESFTGLPLRFGRPDRSSDAFTDWLSQPTPALEVTLELPADEALSFGADALVTRIADVFHRVYPLMLLATESDPLPAIERYLGIVEPPDLRPAYPLTDLARDTHTSEETIALWLAALERKKQAILYGPPGTGKTFVAQKLADHLVGGTDGFVEVVQFHPAYGYEDFIQGIRPQTRPEGGLDYPVMPGRLLRFCAEARGRTGPCVLIIDEINRANLARVFGELMYLLEYREQHVRLAVDGQPFAIPTNVRLLGTMNTADRSIALVDHALRRRFAFFYLAPNYEVLRAWYDRHPSGYQPSGLIALLQRLNAAIGDANYHIGISFFLLDEPQRALPAVWQMEIEPYLEEYFFSQHETVAQFRWERIKPEVLG
jgi:5-methylcytosine-specific restriction protein B